MESKKKHHKSHTNSSNKNSKNSKNSKSIDNINYQKKFKELEKESKKIELELKKAINELKNLNFNENATISRKEKAPIEIDKKFIRDLQLEIDKEREALFQKINKNKEEEIGEQTPIYDYPLAEKILAVLIDVLKKAETQGWNKNIEDEVKLILAHDWGLQKNLLNYYFDSETMITFFCRRLTKENEHNIAKIIHFLIENEDDFYLEGKQVDNLGYSLNDRKSKKGETAPHVGGCFESPIFIASQSGFSSIVTLLIKFNADVNAPKDGNISPLFAACEQGNVEVVKTLLESPEILLDDFRDSCETSLYIACQNGHTEIVTLLINQLHPEECTRLINSQRLPDGATPLYAACQNGYTEIAKILLYNGGDPQIFAKGHGISPFHAAILNKNIEIVKYILENRDEYDCQEIAKLRTPEVLPPLYFACSVGSKEIVELLVNILKTQNTINWDCNNERLSMLLNQNDDLDFFSITPPAKNSLFDLSIMSKNYELIQFVFSYTEDKPKTDKIEFLINYFLKEWKNIPQGDGEKIIRLLVGLLPNNVGNDFYKKIIEQTIRKNNLPALQILMEKNLSNPNLGLKKEEILTAYIKLAVANQRTEITQYLNRLKNQGNGKKVLDKQNKNIEDACQMFGYKKNEIGFIQEVTENEKSQNGFSFLISQGLNKEEIKKMAQDEKERRKREKENENKKTEVELPKPRTWAEGKLSSEQLGLVKTVRHGTNQFFYCPPMFRDKPEFKDILNKDDINLVEVGNGLRNLKGKEISDETITCVLGGTTYRGCRIVAEVKQAHGTQRLYCIQILSDSQIFDEQGSLLIPVIYDDNGLHTNAAMKQLKSSLKSMGKLDSGIEIEFDSEVELKSKENKKEIIENSATKSNLKSKK